MRGDLSGIIGVSFQKMGYRHDNLSVGKVGMGGKNLIMIFIITLDILMVHTG